MKWFFAILYTLSGLFSSAALFFIILISQTGNVGIREDANSITLFGVIVIISITCLSIKFAWKCKEVNCIKLIGLTSLVLVNPFLASATAALAFKYGF
ncbi:MAG: hypothetical protein COB36_00750 [Alphaproteobacteria bacterium]|nr:MAG: hypothetical protein COB36_00750 [Alphaproteobacteria bacterium]